MEGLLQTPITYILIAINVAIHYYFAKQDYGLVDKLKFSPYRVARFPEERSRFITNGFVHANDTHLLVNMFVLWMFGTAVESMFVSYAFGPMMGRLFYLLLYFVAIVIAAYPAYIKHKNNPNYASVGASGATSAVVMAFILFNPWSMLLLFFVIPMPAIVAGIAYLIYSSHMSNQNKDNIAHDAHLWGAVYGLIFTLACVFIFAPSDVLSNIIVDLMNPGTFISQLKNMF